MILDVDAISDIGLVRQVNQDAFFYAVTKEVGLFIVADGMGGHYRGDMASQLAMAQISEWWKKTNVFLASITFFEAVDTLEKEIKRINNYIVEQYRLLKQTGGTTFCALFIHKSAYAVFNIGDSRLYCCEKRKVRQITRDDVWENSLSVSAKGKDPKALQHDKRYGKLTKAMGADMNIAPSLVCGSIERQIVFYICSDGAYKHMSDRVLYNTLKKIKNQGDAERGNRYLKEQIYGEGASDNLSMITVLCAV